MALQEAHSTWALPSWPPTPGTADVVGDAASHSGGDAESLASALVDVLRHGSVRDDLRVEGCAPGGGSSHGGAGRGGGPRHTDPSGQGGRESRVEAKPVPVVTGGGPWCRRRNRSS